MTEYEYSTITPTPIEIRAGIGDASAEQVAADITHLVATNLREMTQILAERPELQGYEIVSHSTTRLDRWLLTTYVLRRPTQSKG